jgi:hypothetical protein
MALVAHDLKAPLAAALGCARMLRDQIGVAEHRDVLGTIERLIARAQRRIDSYSELERFGIEAGHSPTRRRCAWRDVVLEALAAVRDEADAKAVSLEWRDTPDAPCMHADRARLILMLTLVLDHAVACAPGGTQVEIEWGHDASQVWAEVYDAGPSVPDFEQERLFDAWCGVRREGGPSERVFAAGVGLAVARGIAERHHGTLRVLAGNHAGCRLRIQIPLGRPEPTVGAMAVVLVDVSGGLTPAVGPLLARRGVEVFAVQTAGEAARSILLQRPDFVLFESDSLSGRDIHHIQRTLAADDRPLFVAIGNHGPAGVTVLTPPISGTELMALLVRRCLPDAPRGTSKGGA